MILIKVQPGTYRSYGLSCVAENVGVVVRDRCYDLFRRVWNLELRWDSDVEMLVNARAGNACGMH